MRPRLMRHLACPIDHGALELVSWEAKETAPTTEEREQAGALGIEVDDLTTDVATGLVNNPRLRLSYPIYRGVPRMLTFRSGVHAEFERAHGDRMNREYPGYAFPSEPPVPGEEDVLRSFSTEWTNYEWNDRAYWNLTPGRWFDCMRFMLDVERQPLSGKSVLEVGIGIGAFADHLATTARCEVVGVDLGYAVDAAQSAFGNNPFFHIVQASAFAPPFRSESFDFVYSFGVLHHTHSTKTAFDQVSRLPRKGGRLFIWVYSPRHEQRNLVRRTLMRVENTVRPVVWRLPDRAQTAILGGFVPLYMLYQLGRRIRRGRDQVLYGFREAMHAARDRFSPRFIHRHSDEEVKGWFASAGYSELVCASERERPSFVPEAFTVCTGVEGVRR